MRIIIVRTYMFSLLFGFAYFAQFIFFFGKNILLVKKFFISYAFFSSFARANTYLKKHAQKQLPKKKKFIWYVINKKTTTTSNNVANLYTTYAFNVR